MKHRIRFEDGKHVVTIEDDNGKRVDEKAFESYKDAMSLRDQSHAAGVKKFADIAGKAEKAKPDEADTRVSRLPKK